MRIAMCVLVSMCVVAGAAAAQSLEGRKIAIEAGAQSSAYAPVAIPIEGAAVEGSFEAVDAASGKSYPATLAGKELVVLVDKLEPGQKIECALKPRDAAAAPKVAIAKKGDAPELEVVIDGEHFTSYHFSNDEKKPYLWPVYGEAKTQVTRNWPMAEDKTSVKDHPHHKSLWTAYGDVNGVDCWGEGDGSGFQHSDEVTFGSGDAYGWIRAKNTWQDKDHKPVLAEEREYRFYDTPAACRILDETVTFTATQGDVLFKDTKEGGIVAFRMNPALDVAHKHGVITNAEGATGEQGCWGKPSPWCDYSGEMEGVGMRGIAVLDNPANLRYPTRWHVRNYGLNGANCFGLSYFTEKDAERLNGDYTIKNGESLTFTYRIIIHSGDASEAKIADRFADYTQPPKAVLAK